MTGHITTIEGEWTVIGERIYDLCEFVNARHFGDIEEYKKNLNVHMGRVAEAVKLFTEVAIEEAAEELQDEACGALGTEETEAQKKVHGLGPLDDRPH